MAKIPYHLSRRRVWIPGSIAVLILIVVVLSYFISSDILRRYMEHQMNRYLKEYTVHIERAYFHPVTFSLDLENLTLIQDAAPEPPVAYIRKLHAGVHWREILTGHLVADFLIDRPKVYLNLKNVRKEEESKVAFKKKGWQQALEAIYPLKINEFRVTDGELTYIDEGPYKPLHVSRINLQASNIRNIRSPEHVYPSSFRLKGTIFDKGTLVLEGHANFLQEPHLGLNVALDLTNMDLSYFEPITSRSNISLQKGTLSAKGSMEYSPSMTAVNLKNIDIAGVHVNYLHLPQTVAAEEERIKAAGQTATKLSNQPATKIRIDKLVITDGSFGYENGTTQPNYRLFIDHSEVTLTNLTNQFKEGESTLKLKGKFMGTGDTTVTGTFRPYTRDPDFNLNIAIENTQMPPMSDLFRTFGNFDIKEGLFSFYSELKIKGDQVTGYVKPLFRDMKVYDRRDRGEKGLFHKLYVGLVGGAAKLLENRPRAEVVTKTDISGSLASPKTNTLQIIFNLIRNAFIKSILPGFEKEVTNPKSIHSPSATAHSSSGGANSSR
jgi:Domain of Unknown Function (DUF748)